MAEKPQLAPPTAVITFGSPPVAANTAFRNWYRATLLSSWRFVNGNEFASMAPPLPFTTNYDFQHVPALIQAQDMQNTNPTLPTRSDTIALLDNLYRNQRLLSLIIDHNAVLTLRALDDQIPNGLPSPSKKFLEQQSVSGSKDLATLKR